MFAAICGGNTKNKYQGCADSTRRRGFYLPPQRLTDASTGNENESRASPVPARAGRAGCTFLFHYSAAASETDNPDWRYNFSWICQESDWQQ